MTLQHVVLFSFPRELDPAEYAEMRSMIADWPGRIGNIRRLRLGADLTGARTRGYTRLLYMEFDSMEDLQRYRDHPVHQAFNRWIIDHECTPLAFDYFLDDTTLLMPERQPAGAGVSLEETT